jgi:hypothetical protein
MTALRKVAAVLHTQKAPYRGAWHPHVAAPKLIFEPGSVSEDALGGPRSANILNFGIAGMVQGTFL